MLKGSVVKGKEADGGWREGWNALADREFNSRKRRGTCQLLRPQETEMDWEIFSVVIL